MPRCFHLFYTKSYTEIPTSLVCAERKERDGSGSFDRQIDFALMLGAGPRDATRKDFPAFGHEMTERRHVLVVDGFDFVGAALADLSSRSSDFVFLKHCRILLSDQNGISSSDFADPN